MSNPVHFVISHKPIDWELPFHHVVVGVEEYVPECGLVAGDFIDKALAAEMSLGTLRAIPAILKRIENVSDTAQIFHSHYRLFLSSNVSQHWVRRLGRPKVITPAYLKRIQRLF